MIKTYEIRSNKTGETLAVFYGFKLAHSTLAQMNEEAAFALSDERWYIVNSSVPHPEVPEWLVFEKKERNLGKKNEC